MPPSYYSLSKQELTRTQYSTVPDKPFIIKSGNRVLPVHESPLSGNSYCDIDLAAKITTVDWKFFGQRAYILPPGTWNYLKQKRRCKAIFIPLDKAINSNMSKGYLIGFVAASVDILEVSIANGLPLPKKPKRKNKKSNLAYTTGAPSVWKPVNMVINTTSNNPATVKVIQHSGSATRKSDGYVVYSTDNLNKGIKKNIIFQSASSPGKIYHTIVYNDGTVSCNCPAWTKKVPRSCKHLVYDKTIDAIKK